MKITLGNLRKIIRESIDRSDRVAYQYFDLMYRLLPQQFDDYETERSNFADLWDQLKSSETKESYFKVLDSIKNNYEGPHISFITNMLRNRMDDVMKSTYTGDDFLRDIADQESRLSARREEKQKSEKIKRDALEAARKANINVDPPSPDYQYADRRSYYQEKQEYDKKYAAYEEKVKEIIQAYDPSTGKLNLSSISHVK